MIIKQKQKKRNLKMPARSKSQQRLMAMAYVCQKSGFKKCASEKITQLAQSMKEKEEVAKTDTWTGKFLKEVLW